MLFLGITFACIIPMCTTHFFIALHDVLNFGTKLSPIVPSAKVNHGNVLSITEIPEKGFWNIKANWVRLNSIKVQLTSESLKTNIALPPGGEYNRS